MKVKKGKTFDKHWNVCKYQHDCVKFIYSNNHAKIIKSHTIRALDFYMQFLEMSQAAAVAVCFLKFYFPHCAKWKAMPDY